MSYLLDTHTFIWALISPDKISQKASKAINSEKDVYLSTVSIWEISLKYRIGKLKLKGKKPDQIPGAVEQLGFEIVDLEPKVVASFYKLPRNTTIGDPFDLMLIWQAIVGKYNLISKDKAFSVYEKYGLKLIW